MVVEVWSRWLSVPQPIAQCSGLILQVKNRFIFIFTFSAAGYGGEIVDVLTFSSLSFLLHISVEIATERGTVSDFCVLVSPSPNLSVGQDSIYIKKGVGSYKTSLHFGKNAFIYLVS